MTVAIITIDFISSLLFSISNVRTIVRISRRPTSDVAGRRAPLSCDGAQSLDAPYELVPRANPMPLEVGIGCLCISIKSPLYYAP